MSKPITTAERKSRRAAIAEAVAAGREIGEVAGEFGVSLQTARLACREHSVEVPHRQPGSNASISTMKVLKLLLQHIPPSEIAKQLGLHPTSVWRVARAAREAGFELTKEKA